MKTNNIIEDNLLYAAMDNSMYVRGNKKYACGCYYGNCDIIGKNGSLNSEYAVVYFNTIEECTEYLNSREGYITWIEL